MSALRRLSVSTRLIALIVVMLIVLALVSIGSLNQSRELEQELEDLHQAWITRLAQLQRLANQPNADVPAVRREIDALNAFEAELARRHVQDDTGLVSRRTLMFAVIAAAFWVAILGGIRIVRSVIRPLTGVTRQLQQFTATRHDLTARLAVEGSDEIAAFARSFNSVLDELLNLVTRVRTSGTQVSSSVVALAASAKELEATMTEQAASTNEVVASAKTISATADNLVATMEEVGTLSQAAAGSADAGQVGLERMSDTVRQMEAASRSISEKLEVINGRATNITGVVTTIAKIADQTNLLSLNAAIEAAKAGEAGEGFTVVAREIRRLADKTAVATLEIERMVKEMQSAVTAGVMGMEKFSDEVRRAVEDVHQVGEQFTRIIDQVHALTPRFESVTQGMSAQSTGAGQISEAMVQLSEATRHTAAGLRESRRAIDQLNEAARGLEREFTRFQSSPRATTPPFSPPYQPGPAPVAQQS